MVSVFFGVLFVVGGVALARYRRGYMALLREIGMSVRRYDPGDRYMRRMEWMAVAVGGVSVIYGVLLILGVVDLFPN